MQKNNIITYVLIALMFVVTFLPINQVFKLVGMAVVLILIVYFTRGTLYFIQANKQFNKSDFDKAMRLYKKAVKAGISAKFMGTAGAIAIGMGETAWAKEVLTKAMKKVPKKEITLLPSLQTSLSMAYWVEGDLDKAIELAETAYNNGYKDKNVFINLCTYYLEKEDLTSFRKLIKEYRNSSINNSPALADLNAASMMLSGDWAKAKNILTQLFEKKDFHFPDPYVHLAQINLFYGNFASALSALQRGLDNCKFTKTSVIEKETIEKLISIIKEPEKNAGYIIAINKDPLSLINGKIPSPIENATLTFEKEKVEEQIEKIEKAIETEDDGDINTDLTDDDEEWIRKHSN